MIPYPEIDPIIISVGPLALRWYGVMYLIGFAGAWWLTLRALTAGRAPLQTRAQAEDLIFYGALGVIFGGRVG